MTINFHKDKQGLPYINVGEQGVMFAQTLYESMEGYSTKELEKAVLCYKVSGLVGHPSLKNMEYLVSNKEIEDCPLNIHDLKTLMPCLVIIKLQECKAKL